MRSYGKPRKPKIQRVAFKPATSAKKLILSPGKHAASPGSSDDDDSSSASSVPAGRRKDKGGAEDEGTQPLRKRRKRKRCFSRGPKGRPKKEGVEEDSEKEESDEEESPRRRPKIAAKGRGKVSKKTGSKRRKMNHSDQDSGEEEVSLFSLFLSVCLDATTVANYF
jgi:hypothetical protein